MFYIALVHKEAGSAYGVSFPDLPGCVSAGDSFEDAVASAIEALGLHVPSLAVDPDRGRPLEHLGRLAEAEGDRETAARYYERAISARDPDRDALSAFRRAYALDRNDPYPDAPRNALGNGPRIP